MLHSHSRSLFYPPPLIKFSLGKYSSKTNVHFSAINQPERNTFIRKTDVLHKRNSNFTRCHSSVPLAGLPAPLPAVVTDPEDGHEGIGILEFFEGKNIFITGATGFLGKVIVEKILRSTTVGKVYLLIKAKDKEAAFDRLKSEIISSELFTCLKEKYGNSYEDFVREKLIPIAGNILEPNLGMDKESIDSIRKDVHVIIQSAASTTFDGRYDLLIDANVIAPQRVMRFAKTCNKLQLFTHISTAYVNEKREGIIMEKPLFMGGNDVALDVSDEISLLLKSSPTHVDATKFFRKLGQERAKAFGWSTTYQLSKAMGEMVVNDIRGDVPLLIIRPSIVESCYNEPVPGWIQGIRMSDPVIISYGKGLLPAFFGNPRAHLDIMPVDLVANTTIAAIAKHGSKNMPQFTLYHVASSHSNPVTLFEYFEYMHEYFETTPLIESSNISKVKFFNNFNEFSEYTRDELLRQSRNGGEDGKRIRECNAMVGYVEQLCKMYEFATFFNGRFHTGRTEKLNEEMSKEERLNFEVDVKNIDWKKYAKEIHIPGLIKYVINSA